jgi:hypothetical protein
MLLGALKMVAQNRHFSIPCFPTCSLDDLCACPVPELKLAGLYFILALDLQHRHPAFLTFKPGHIAVGDHDARERKKINGTFGFGVN